MADNSLAGLRASLRGELITRDDKEAFTAARFRGWNRDLNARANPLGFVVASGVRDMLCTSVSSVVKIRKSPDPVNTYLSLSLTELLQ